MSSNHSLGVADELERDQEKKEIIEYLSIGFYSEWFDAISMRKNNFVAVVAVSFFLL